MKRALLDMMGYGIVGAATGYVILAIIAGWRP